MTSNGQRRCSGLRVRRAFSVLALSSLALGCGTSPDAPDDTSQDDFYAIQNGTRDYGHPAVGQVGTENTGDHGTCTGTLINKSWILTTRHCKMLDAFLTGTGPKDFKQHKLGVPEYHPGGYLTMVPLLEPITDIAPLDYHGKVPNLKQVCLSVGFGFHNGADGKQTIGTKYAATSIVADVADGRLLVHPGTGAVSPGDSGGPLICGGKVVGVADTAGQNFVADARYPLVDADWIDLVIRSPGSVSPPDAADPSVDSNEEPASLVPEMRVLGSSGDLCPEGTLHVEDRGALSFGAPPGHAPLVRETTQRCKVDLAVSVPAGAQFEALDFELNAATNRAQLPLPASLTASVEGREVSRITDRLGPLGRVLHAKVPTSKVTCSSSPSELHVSLELMGRVPKGEMLTVYSLTLAYAEVAQEPACAAE